MLDSMSGFGHDKEKGSKFMTGKFLIIKIQEKLFQKSDEFRKHIKKRSQIRLSKMLSTYPKRMLSHLMSMVVRF